METRVNWPLFCQHFYKNACYLMRRAAAWARMCPTLALSCLSGFEIKIKIAQKTHTLFFDILSCSLITRHSVHNIFTAAALFDSKTQNGSTTESNEKNVLFGWVQSCRPATSPARVPWAPQEPPAAGVQAASRAPSSREPLAADPQASQAGLSGDS